MRTPKSLAGSLGEQHIGISRSDLSDTDLSDMDNGLPERSVSGIEV